MTRVPRPNPGVLLVAFMTAALLSGCAKKDEKPVTQPAPAPKQETAGPLTPNDSAEHGTNAADLTADQNQTPPPPESPESLIDPATLEAPELASEFAEFAPAPPPPPGPGQLVAPPPRKPSKSAGKDDEADGDTNVTVPPSPLNRWACYPKGTVNTQLIIHHYNVGQGDSTFIRTPNGGVTILIDGGEAGNQDAIIDILKQCYDLDGVDYMVLSHPHSDHFGGLTGLLKLAVAPSPAFKVNKGVYMTAFDLSALKSRTRDPSLGTKVEEFMKLADTLNKKVGQRNLLLPFGDKAFVSRNAKEPVRFDVIVRDGKLAKNDEQAEIFKSDGKTYKKLNPTSAGIHIKFKTFDYLTAGDLTGPGRHEPDVETLLVDHKVLTKMDVVKSSHHGSDTSNSPAFLDAVDPLVYIISTGDSGQNTNTFHLPRLEPVLEMHARAVKKNGFVFMTSCGAGNVMPVHPFCTKILPRNLEREKEKGKAGRPMFDYLHGDDGTTPGGMRRDLKKFLNTQGDIVLKTDGSSFTLLPAHDPVKPAGKIEAVDDTGMPFEMTPEKAKPIGPFKTDGR